MPSLARTAAALALTLGVAASLPGPAAGLASHDGWPPMDMLVMNKDDSSRPLDARPGFDPFGGVDPSYSCDTQHRLSASCAGRFEPAGDGFVVTGRAGHSRLLGGHGNDRLHASPWGDVLWGDYKPSGQPGSQRDRLIGGGGPDFIYAGQVRNVIRGGAGSDAIHAHFGRGHIDCGPGRDIVYIANGHR